LFPTLPPIHQIHHFLPPALTSRNIAIAILPQGLLCCRSSVLWYGKIQDAGWETTIRQPQSQNSFHIVFPASDVDAHAFLTNSDSRRDAVLRPTSEPGTSPSTEGPVDLLMVPKLDYEKEHIDMILLSLTTSANGVRHTLAAMNPLLPLRSFSAHVKQRNGKNQMRKTYDYCPNTRILRSYSEAQWDEALSLVREWPIHGGSNMATKYIMKFTYCLLYDRFTLVTPMQVVRIVSRKTRGGEMKLKFSIRSYDEHSEE
jgi:hypothetical protein